MRDGVFLIILSGAITVASALLILFTIAALFTNGYTLLFIFMVGYNSLGRLLAMAIPSFMCLIPSSKIFLSFSLNQRRFNFKSADAGITLFSIPAWNAPTVRTAASWAA